MTLCTEKAVSPTTGEATWLLVDEETYAPHPEAREFSLYLRGAGRSTADTARVHPQNRPLPQLVRTERGTGWRTVRLGDMSLFKFHLERDTRPQYGRLPSGKTVNATLTAVCEFLRFCAVQGHVDHELLRVSASRASSPRPRPASIPARAASI